MMQIFDYDNRNNCVKFEKDSPFYFEYLNNKVWYPYPLKSMVISILLNIEAVKFL